MYFTLIISLLHSPLIWLFSLEIKQDLLRVQNALNSAIYCPTHLIHWIRMRQTLAFSSLQTKLLFLQTYLSSFSLCKTPLFLLFILLWGYHFCSVTFLESLQPKRINYCIPLLYPVRSPIDALHTMNSIYGLYLFDTPDKWEASALLP